MTTTKQEAFSKNLREQVQAARMLIENDENVVHVVAISVEKKFDKNGDAIVQKSYDTSDETNVGKANAIIQGLMKEVVRLSAIVAKARAKK